MYSLINDPFQGNEKGDSLEILFNLEKFGECDVGKVGFCTEFLTSLSAN